MYQATGNRSSCAKTATPRPHRLPVHSAHPAASNAAADDGEPGSIAETADRGLVGTAESAHHERDRRDESGDAFECHEGSGLSHGCRRGNGHEASLLSVIVVRYRGELGTERPRSGI